MLNNINLSINNSLFQKIIDTLPVLLFWTDQNNILMGNNLAHANAFGFLSAEELVGKSMVDTFKELGFDYKLVNRVYKEHDEIMQTKKGQILEYTNILSDKQKHTHLSHKEPLLNENNEVIGLIGVSMEITQLKQAEEVFFQVKEIAEQANLLKPNFLSTMSHELLSTPMSGILGMAQQVLPRDKHLSAQNQQIKFTPRELDCLKLLAQGRTMKEIGKMLGGISPRTVETHLIRVKDKLGCNRKSEILDFIWSNQNIIFAKN